ncbi:hypothetical protein Csal_2259 [Chromohalobacter israelensis DSM 3043]|uniref:Uncharacterized protein n=1 Tax=Chromohalobacter israelensis (strain ATCC BAA-138 / DSM 3043 / CIP 106854 / NCIMB 13768 / 1H11) TaxID=290398 RepID=Q1QV99_CHRI1|nr:hypothetical protein Csal_2259 [Chromohalobacter salexigens DSM 3043]
MIRGPFSVADQGNHPLLKPLLRSKRRPEYMTLNAAFLDEKRFQYPFQKAQNAHRDDTSLRAALSVHASHFYLVQIILCHVNF